MSGESPLFAGYAPGDGFTALRRRAREAFLARGLPDRRNENYKYTDLTPLGAASWPRARGDTEAPVLPVALGRRTVWLDGRLAAGETGTFLTPLPGGGREKQRDPGAPVGEQADLADPIVALNTALFDHGARIDVPAGTRLDEPLELVFAHGTREGPAATHARVALRLGRGSRCVLIERHIGAAGPALATRVAEVELGPGAELWHLRLNEAGAATWLLGHTAVRVGEQASYRCLGLDLGGKLERESLCIRLQSPGAHAELAGLAILDGRRHADSHVLVEHAAAGTRSRQHFRGVLDGHSRNAYTGRVRVASGAQKSDAEQKSANLLLSRRAEADCRPQLEIYADDVACSHGAATGAIDPEALFYLRSRGIDADAARRMIAYGFAAHVLDTVDDHRLRRPLAVLLAERMQTAEEVGVWL